MIRMFAAAALLLAGAPQDDPPQDDVPLAGMAVAQVTVRQQIIVRVPRGPQQRVEASSPGMRWREVGGPRCIPANRIAGALPRGAAVDLVLSDRRRVRARFGQRCGGLDYYRGLYLTPHRDGQVCAGRDAVRSRMGGLCGITEFRLLQPVRP